MKYGAMNFPVKPVLDEMDLIAGLGFDYLELAMDPPCAHHTILLRQQKEIIASLDRYELDLICHLPTFVYIADLTESIRRVSLNEMIKSLEAAKALGAAKVVLHPGYIGGMGVYVMEASGKYASESLTRIVEKADNLGLLLCLENMFPMYQSFFETDDFRKAFEKFPTLKLTLDTGHANINDVGKKRVFTFIHEFGDRIGHLHISDNHGQKDEHLAMGEGTIDFRSIVQELIKTGYNDTVTLEIFSENKQDIKSSRKLFMELAADPG